MTAPYNFTRRVDNQDQRVVAEYFNELQRAVETLAIKSAGVFESGKPYGPVTSFSGVFTTTAAVVAGRLYAVPFWTGPDGITLTNLSIEVTTLSAGNARLGVYAADTDPPYFPAARLLDAGEVATGTTGIKTIDITDTQYIGAAPSHLIWLAAVFQATPTVRMVQQLSQIVGITSGGDHQAGVYMTHAYAALPATFDDPPDGFVQSVPNIWGVAA
jgi:hypothetical protein